MNRFQKPGSKAGTWHLAALLASASSAQAWEHVIRDETDFARHMDYSHFNPVKHGYVNKVSDWPYSSFYRYVWLGLYPENWLGALNEDLAYE